MTQPIGLDIDVIADVVCPWSFVGKRRLDRALASYSGPIHIVWHPFQLNPDLPPGGVDFETYLRDRFGGRERVAPALAQLEQLGSDNGIRFDFRRLKRVPNTLSAHRLMLLARERNQQGELAETVFRAFFEEGQDVGNPAVLAELASGLGWPARDVDRTLADETSRKIIAAEEAQARRMGFVSTPSYLFNRRVLLPGAADVNTLVSAFAAAAFPEDPDDRPVVH